MIFLKAGDIIKSTSLLNGTEFENTEILICEVNENGSWGFVTNQPFSRKLNELVEFKNNRALVLFQGGPMENEKLFLLHKCGSQLKNSQLLFDHTFFGGDIRDALMLIEEDKILETQLTLFIGYCGWDNYQLQEEIEEGSWLLFQKK